MKYYQKFHNDIKKSDLFISSSLQAFNGDKDKRHPFHTHCIGPEAHIMSSVINYNLNKSAPVQFSICHYDIMHKVRIMSIIVT